MKDLLKRKQIRLKDYDYSSAGMYFLTVCVNDRHEMLGKVVVDDAHIVQQFTQLSGQGKIVQKYIENINLVYDDVLVDKYVIMPNHIHMIIVLGYTSENWTMWASSTTKVPISNIIRSFKVLVSKEIGFSIFQRSYHDHIIRNESEYQKIWQYIDTNPAKWEEDKYYIRQQAEGRK